MDLTSRGIRGQSLRRLFGKALLSARKAQELPGAIRYFSVGGDMRRRPAVPAFLASVPPSTGYFSAELLFNTRVLYRKSTS